MELPCKMCTNCTYKEAGFRAFMGCNDDEKSKGFHEDRYWYRHTCDNLTIREECQDCVHNKKPYCNSVVAFVDGKCIDKTTVERKGGVE